MNLYALIVAGGSGRRMSAGMPKQFLLLHGKSLLWYTLRAFQQAFTGINIVLVLPEDHQDAGWRIVASTMHPGGVQIVTGGPSRFHSVQNGLQQVPAGSIVAIHDGVRCLVTPALIRQCVEAAIMHGNAIPAVAAVDTIRLITGNGSVVADRSKVRLVQTPQTFYSDVVKEAYGQPYDEGFTDDASVVEKQGEKIHLVEGEATNLKITQPVDLAVAESILEERERAASL